MLQTELCNYDSAIKHLKQLLASGDSTDQIHNLIGHAYQKSEDYSNAAVHYESALELQPEYEEAATNLKIVQEKIQQISAG